jgi:hypothetical protein
MVSQEYLLDMPSRSSRPRQLFAQRVLPELIDLAGWLESGLERIAVGTRRHPARGLGLALGVGVVLSLFSREVRLKVDDEDG